MQKSREVIRIRYRIGEKKEFILNNGVKEVKSVTPKYSRPYKAVKITYTDESIKWFKINEGKKKRGLKELNPDNFITKWEEGNTPLPKPSHKYNDEKLKEHGYTTEQIKEIRLKKSEGRPSAKTISKIWKKYRNTNGSKETRQIVAKLLEDKVITVQDFYTTIAEKKENKLQHTNPGALRARKMAQKVTRNKRKISKAAKKLKRRN